MTAENISLYLDLEPGERPDFEVVARASLAFIDIIKEISLYVDPLSNLKIELLDSSEGSLFLNAILKTLGKLRKDKINTATIFLACLIWLGNKTADFAWDKVSNKIWEQFTGDKAADFSEDEKKEIRDIIQKVEQAKVGEKQAQRYYRELMKDPAIKGTGITDRRSTKPATIVEKYEFSERAGLTNHNDRTIKRRVRIEKVSATLISPVLLEGNRRWRFRTLEGEFGASMKDTHFLKSLLSGQLEIMMKGNVVLTIEIETIDEFRNNVWTPVERNVLRIIGVPRQLHGEQQSLFSDEK